jgi:hypothetical protein
MFKCNVGIEVWQGEAAINSSMLSFKQFVQESAKLAPGAPKTVPSMLPKLPQFPNLMRQRRASAKQARGLIKHAAKLQAQARLAQQAAAAKATRAGQAQPQHKKG